MTLGQDTPLSILRKLSPEDDNISIIIVLASEAYRDNTIHTLMMLAEVKLIQVVFRFNSNT